MTAMSVGAAANAVGVSARAIRLWKSKGLIPKLERTTTGYRTFTASDLAVVHFIQQGKALGLTLEEIKNIIDLQQAGVCSCPRVVQAIDAHLAVIERSIAELSQLRDTLSLARRTADTESHGERSRVVCQIIERD